MASYNPVTPDSIYGELQPETFSAGMRGEHFGPDVAAMMLPEGATQTEVNRAIAGYQQNVLPIQQALEQARARQDKQAMELHRFRIAQEGHRMSLRSSELSARKSQFELEKSIWDSKQEAETMRRVPEVVDQLDGISRDPTLDTYQKASEVGRLQGLYAPHIGRSPAFKSIFDAWHTSNAAVRAGETQKWERGFRLGREGYGPATTMPEYAEGQQAKTKKALEKEGRDNQIKYLTDEWQYFDDLEKRLDDLDTMYHAADPATGIAAEASGQYGGEAPKVDRTMPKVYTPEARDTAIFIAQQIGESSGMTQQQIEELVKEAADMPRFIPLLRSGLNELRARNLDQKGSLYGHDPAGGTSPTAPSIGSWGAPST